ncbi:MAG: hypothetical protein LPK19_03895 [Hymenobacteraceae bacterium]|nr:hypothetical protein [Hymenobacteraceae bacterium]MDX5395337.1 hypothetical protein [Hymenobacteraceae bacterium]MDX5511388.1 hypothetical protein [Hymenobacteraceae bacterium]
MNDSFAMGAILLLILYFAVLPFAIATGVNAVSKNQQRQQFGITISMIVILIAALTLPFIFELGGVIILSVCLAISGLLYFFRNEVNKKIFVFNILTGIVIVFLNIIDW